MRPSSSSRAPGISTPLGSSQCGIDLAHASVAGSSSASGGTGALVFTLAVTFSGAFEGSKEMWGLGVNSAGVYSPWVDLGAYSVTAASIWPATAVANTWDSASLTVGVKFQSSVSGNITGIRYYSGVAPSGTQIGLLYSVSGTLLAQATFSGGTAVGWQQVSFTTPVAITANTVYVAAYFSTIGFAYNAGYFTSAGVTNPPLQALEYGVSGPNGVYAYGSAAQFPSNDGGGANYWADVVFSSTSTLVGIPDMTVASSHIGSFTQGQNGATYAVTASNIGNGPTSGTVTVTETLPTGLAAVSMAGSGWTCTQPAGPCTRSDALAAGLSYGPITVTVNVSSTAPASVTNGASNYRSLFG